MALNGLFSADMPLRNYSLTHSATLAQLADLYIKWTTAVLMYKEQFIPD